MPRSPIRLIGLHGKARSGKDTAADFLLNRYGGYKYSLATPLKAMVKAGLGIDPEDPFWVTRKEKPIPAYGNKSPRVIWQTLGTEWGRELISPDLWITLAQQRLVARGPGMIVPDVRFENEAAWIRRLGGKLIFISRKDAPSVAAHSSESGLTPEPGDIIIKNDGSLEDLFAALTEVFDVQEA